MMYKMPQFTFMKPFSIILFSLLFMMHAEAQELNKEEKYLYDLLMSYRKSNSLPEIALSPSLTYVAQQHVKDLESNKPDTGKCNLHSWSSNGKWTAMCYTSDHAKAKNMWSKPIELTHYPGRGYEIASMSSDSITAKEAIQLWKASSGHNAVMINQGIWKNVQWNAVGVGIYGKYAVLWFGEEKDNGLRIK